MSSQVSVAVAQINCTVGDLEGNSRRIVDAARRAAAARADILLTPELSLTGYPPEDLLLRRAFYGAVDEALAALAAQLLQFAELRVIVGHPLAREGRRFNAASLLHGGVVGGSYCKHDLPNYDVFDEQRYFTPDNRPFVFEVKGTRFAINICEDTWYPYAPEAARAAGAQVLLVPNGSPYHLGKTAQRLDKMRENVSRAGLPLVYANLVGGQDELVFDGASFVLDAAGTLACMAPQFEEHLLLRRAFYGAVDAALAALAAQLLQFAELRVIVGHPLAREGRRFNAASLLHGGVVGGSYCKHDLPNYDVFDEQRYFTPDNRPFVFEVKGTRFAINICEDTWYPYAPEAARAAGAQVLLVPNGSPYHLGKTAQRLDKMRENVSRAGLPLVYANLVGGQDELVFDGASFVLDAAGTLACMAPQFEEHLLLAHFVDGVPQAGERAEPGSLEHQAYGALRLGVRDYLGKNGFPGAVIGLSGGIDSALTLAIAVDALGPDRVRAVMMPSQFTADISWIDSRAMVERLNVRYEELPIKPVFDSFLATLAREFRGLPWDTTEENIQARIRGTLLMALTNKYGSIVLTTGNKSEMAVGYCTLYGDMAGGFAVIRDIRKTLVYRLARYRNSLSEVIPERIITRPPSAELRPGQTDQDSLPPYDILDGIIELYMEEGASLPEIVAAGYSAADVNRVVRLIRISEYKRRQAPVGIRVTHRGFGRDWRYPITNKFREEIAS